jgi:hypothetical protein
MSTQFGNPKRLRSLGGARLGGVGRSLNRSGSRSTPTIEGITKATKAAKTSMNRASSTEGPPIRGDGRYSRPDAMVIARSF